MSDQEQLERFRAVLLTAIKVFRETRKDVAKCQIQIIALKESFAKLDPQWGKHFQKVLEDMETSLASRRTPAEIELEQSLDDLIVLLSLNTKHGPN